MDNLIDLSDEELVDYIRNEDKEAYKEVVKRYKEKLLRYAIYLTGDQDLAVDIVQESFISAFVNLNNFSIKKKFSSWIYRIVHNRAISFLRKDKNIFSLFDFYGFDSGSDLEGDFEKKEIRRMVNSCLDQIPVLYREPLVLYFLEDKTYDEISDILRIPVGTVGTRISRAKVIMRKLCKRLK